MNRTAPELAWRAVLQRPVRMMLVAALDRDGEIVRRSLCVGLRHEGDVVTFHRLYGALRHSITFALQTGVVNGVSPMDDAKPRVLSAV